MAASLCGILSRVTTRHATASRSEPKSGSVKKACIAGKYSIFTGSSWLNTFLEMERCRERGKTAKAEFGLITIRLDHGNMAIMLSDADETTEANGKFGMALARAITNSRRSRWLWAIADKVSKDEATMESDSLHRQKQKHLYEVMLKSPLQIYRALQSTDLTSYKRSRLYFSILIYNFARLDENIFKNTWNLMPELLQLATQRNIQMVRTKSLTLKLSLTKLLCLETNGSELWKVLKAKTLC